MTLRLLTYNIKYGGTGRAPAIARVINSCAPDVVLLQEATRPAIVEQIAADTGMAEWRSFARQSLAFLALSVIPSLKITDRGLVDVDRFELVGATS